MNQKYVLRSLSLLLCLLVGLTSFSLPARAEDIRRYSSSSASIAVGEKKDLSSFVFHRSRSEHEEEEGEWYFVGGIQWSSSNKAVATVSSSGVVTGHRLGVATITASAWDNQSRRHTQSVALGVNDGTVEALTLPEYEYTFSLPEGKRINLGALLHPGYKKDGSYGTVTWESKDPSIASVDESGLVKARSIGKTTVTATHTAPDGAVETRKVTVHTTALLIDNRSNPITITLPAGGSVNLLDVYYPNYSGMSGIGKNIGLRTSLAEVAALSGGHAVTGKAAGSCTVTMEYKENNIIKETQKFTVKVVNP